ncbi:MAG: hypothetical protein ACRDP8_02320 [Actinopolymorphaceae bacterium]
MLVTAFVVTGCSDAASPADPARLDMFDRNNVSFFEPAGYGESALEPEHYETVKDAAQHASAVVIAEVADVRQGETTIGETPNDIVSRVAIDIRIVEVIKGELEDDSPDTLTLQRLASGDSVEESIAYMKAHLPEGMSVWFLRNHSDYYEQMKGEPLQTTPEHAYRLLSSQGLFVQGQNSVANPLVGADQGMADQARGNYTKLSDLVDFVRSVDGWTGVVPGRRFE